MKNSSGITGSGVLAGTPGNPQKPETAVKRLSAVRQGTYKNNGEEPAGGKPADGPAADTHFEFLFRTRVIGTSVYSGSLRSRLKAVRDLEPGEFLQVKPKLDRNVFVDLAAVYNSRNQEIGHLPVRSSPGILREMASGKKFCARVEQLTEIEKSGFFTPYLDLEISVFRLGERSSGNSGHTHDSLANWNGAAKRNGLKLHKNGTGEK